MRTTLDLPENLVKEAMDVSGAKTKTMAISLALQDFVRHTRMKRILDYEGKIDLDLDEKRIKKERRLR
jgi:hypothetical protein